MLSGRAKSGCFPEPMGRADRRACGIGAEFDPGCRRVAHRTAGGGGVGPGGCPSPAGKTSQGGRRARTNILQRRGPPHRGHGMA